VNQQNIYITLKCSQNVMAITARRHRRIHV